jgi:hypothetical protein
LSEHQIESDEMACVDGADLQILSAALCVGVLEKPWETPSGFIGIGQMGPAEFSNQNIFFIRDPCLVK